MVADIAIDHPSCSKQHAVIQCLLIPISKRKVLILSLDRYVQEKDEFGDSKGTVKLAALFPDYLFLIKISDRLSLTLNQPMEPTLMTR